MPVWCGFGFRPGRLLGVAADADLGIARGDGTCLGNWGSSAPAPACRG